MAYKGIQSQLGLWIMLIQELSKHEVKGVDHVVSTVDIGSTLLPMARSRPVAGLSKSSLVTCQLNTDKHLNDRPQIALIISIALPL